MYPWPFFSFFVGKNIVEASDLGVSVAPKFLFLVHSELV